MTDYSKCKIYKIVTPNGVYIGHTVQELEKRKCVHKGTHTRCVTRLIEEDYEMELIEDYPCLNKTEARLREQHFMDLEPVLLNENRAITEIDEINRQQRERYAKYKANNPNLSKERYAKAKERDGKQKKTQTPCPICGIIMNRSSIGRHKKRFHSNQIPVSVGLEYMSPSDLSDV